MRQLWSHPGLIQSLQRLTFFERASAHVLSGWIAKTPTLAVKAVMAQHLYEAMEQAGRLRQVLSALGHGEPDLLVACRRWSGLMARLDALLEPSAVLPALYLVVRARQLASYRELLENADPLLDAQLVRLIRRYLPDIEAQQHWAESMLDPLSRSAELAPIAALAEDCWNMSAASDAVALDDALWDPVDRVPSARRPEGWDRGEDGAFPVLAEDSLRDPRGIAIFLHNFISEEYTTLELMSRSSYEHQELPWAFHLGIARQASDEARHALIQERVMAGYGVQYGDFPGYVTTYDLLYQFDPCEQGSKRELLWRLMLRSNWQEAVQLDDLVYELRKREFLGQPELVKTYSYLLVDEVFHVENGLHWARALGQRYGFDVLAERDLARDYFISLENHRRLQFIVRNPERAIGEAERLQRALEQHRLPFKRKLEQHLRTQAGFTADDLQQIRDWGIYPES